MQDIYGVEVSPSLISEAISSNEIRQLRDDALGRVRIEVPLVEDHVGAVVTRVWEPTLVA